MWLARNNARDGRRIEEGGDIVRVVLKVMEEWQSTHGRTSKSSRVAPLQRWEAPDNGCIKANVDDATSKSGGKWGAGVVFRNHEGGFLGGACISPRVRMQQRWS